MMLLFMILVGLCAGSFAFAMTLRMHDGRDWVRGRSECEHCRKTLVWYDLIPVFSWLSTGGKCRYCKKAIGRSYIAVELSSGLLFAVSYIFWPYGFTRAGIAVFALWLAMLTVLVSLIIFDIKWYLLPDRLVFTLIAMAGVSKLFQVVYYQDFSRLIGIVYGTAVGAGIFYALYALSKGRYIGGGDVKYGIFSGILLASGFKSLLVISIGSLLGTLAVVPSVIKHRTKLTSQIPFGPFLILATIIMYLFGDKVISVLTTFYLFP